MYDSFHKIRFLIWIIGFPRNFLPFVRRFRLNVSDSIAEPTHIADMTLSIDKNPTRKNNRAITNGTNLQEQIRIIQHVLFALLARRRKKSYGEKLFVAKNEKIRGYPDISL